MNAEAHVLTEGDAAAYIEVGVTAWELVRLRWPDMTEEQCDWVLWERTPFPMVMGVHDIADAVADIDDTICGAITEQSTCRRRVKSFGLPCWQHREDGEAPDGRWVV